MHKHTNGTLLFKMAVTAHLFLSPPGKIYENYHHVEDDSVSSRFSKCFFIATIMLKIISAPLLLW